MSKLLTALLAGSLYVPATHTVFASTWGRELQALSEANALAGVGLLWPAVYLLLCSAFVDFVSEGLSSPAYIPLRGFRRDDGNTRTTATITSAKPSQANSSSTAPAPSQPLPDSNR